MVGEINIYIKGKPIAKKRPRFVRQGRYVRTYDEQMEDKRTVKSIIRAQCSEKKEGPLSVEFLFFVPIPASLSKKKKEQAQEGQILPTKKPDCDNYIKFYLDCMNGICWHDDAQVVGIKARKVYDENPRTEIFIGKT